MKTKNPVFLYGAVVVLLSYGVFSTFKIQRLESRVVVVESQIDHILHPVNMEHPWRADTPIVRVK
jgi:hypothetical protein